MSFNLRSFLFKLHSYLAIAVAVYVAILGITGAIMAFDRDLYRLANAKQTYVAPAPPRLSFAELGAAVAKVYPDRPIFDYALGDAPNLSTQVLIGAGTRTGVVAVYVNPYTGEVLGEPHSTVGKVLDFIHSFHQRLTPPRPGRDKLTRAFMSWVSVAALFLVVSGIWLWWPQMRFGFSASRGRPFWYDVHVTLGIVAAAFLILLTISGMALGFEGSTPLLYALTGSQPPPQPKRPEPPAGEAQPITLDQAFAIAAKALPGATLNAIGGPTPRGYIARASTPSQRSPRTPSVVFIDQYTGAVLAAENADTAPAGARLAALVGNIHTANIGGFSGRAILALASLIIALQALSGIVMWIKRVPPRAMIPALVATAAVTAIAVYTVFAPNS